LAELFYISYLLVVGPSIVDATEVGAGLLLRATLFCVIFGLMTYFGPLLNAWLVSYSVYMFQDTGAIIIWPVMESIISLLIDGATSGVVLAYTVIFIAYTSILNGFVIFK
jgi:hypothetical protein